MIPIVIVGTGGSPFIAVERGAPAAVVATNGLGLPITLVESDAPALVISGLIEEPEE